MLQIAFYLEVCFKSAVLKMQQILRRVLTNVSIAHHGSESLEHEKWWKVPFRFLVKTETSEAADA